MSTQDVVVPPGIEAFSNTFHFAPACAGRRLKALLEIQVAARLNS